MREPICIQIERAELRHVKYLSDFGRRSFIAAYQCTLPLNELNAYVEHAFSVSCIREEIGSSSSVYFVAVNSEGSFCGYAKLRHSSVGYGTDSACSIELQRLYVDEEFRGAGVGRQLNECGELYARERSIREVWLRVWNGNKAAQTIYKRWGFKFVGEEEYMVGNARRIVYLMRKHLC